MKMAFTEQEVTVMHAELAAICERVHKVILLREIAVSPRSEQMHNLRL